MFPERVQMSGEEQLGVSLILISMMFAFFSLLEISGWQQAWYKHRIAAHICLGPFGHQA